jgi:Permuted papain-like amidase enzyme, YaeF/YiiX, C92 family
MKKILVYTTICLLILGGYYMLRQRYNPKRSLQEVRTELAKLGQNGDLIFQTSLSSQSQAIQAATHSKYSHCGILYIENGKYFVFEAVQPVKMTPLANWIARGEDGHYVIKRLKDAERILTPEVLQKMKERYGNKIPLEETVISPAAIFESNVLQKIKEN